MSEDSDILRHSASQFTRREYDFAARRKSIETRGAILSGHWSSFAELGWLAAALPEDVGGLGGSIAETSAILEELGKALIAEPLLGCGVLGAQVLERAATGDQRSALLERVASGDIRVSLAHEEDGARGDLDFVDAQATPHGDGFLIKGSKRAALGAPDSQHLIVSARLDGQLSLFIVETGQAGAILETYTGYDGLSAANITFTDLVVPAGALLAQGRGAQRALRWGYDQFLLAEAAIQLGVMQVAFDHTRDYLTTRKQFGKALAEFQVLQHRLADMYIGIEEVRALHARCIASARRYGTVAPNELAALSYRLRQVARFVAMQAVQLHGGIGLTDEYIVGHCCRYLTVAGLRHGDAGRELDCIADGLAN